tara:strand:- start:9290 stop:9940 length:651 start_codon:yes stop_codon:yes gene_type:complete
MTEKKSTKKKLKKSVSDVIPSHVDSQESLDVSSMLKDLTKNVSREVVSLLKPEMEKGIDSRFEQIKQIVINEMTDMRKNSPEQKTENTSQAVNALVEQAQQSQTPDGENKQTQTPNKFEMFAQILPLVQQLGILGNNNQQGMGGMIQEALMRKFLADTSRSDYLNQAMTNYMMKNMLKTDSLELESMNKTDNELMSPLKKYGDISEAKKQQSQDKQ